jgi:hypothetical protein
MIWYISKIYLSMFSSFFFFFIENNTHILIIKKDVIIYQGRKIKIRDYRKKIIQYPSFPYSSKVYVFYALHMQREREREGIGLCFIWNGEKKL